MTDRELIENFMDGASEGNTNNLMIVWGFVCHALKSNQKIIALRLHSGVVILNGQKYSKSIAEIQSLLKEIAKEKEIILLHSDEKTIVNYHLNPLRDSKYEG